VLTAERQALQDPQEEQDDRCGHMDHVVARQEADGRRARTHDQQRDEEGVLPADEVADASEEDGSERPDDETDGEGRQVQQQRDGLTGRGRVEPRRQRRGQRAEDVEVVPLDDRARRCGHDHLPDGIALLGLHLRFTDTCLGHAFPPSGTGRPVADIRKCSSTAGSKSARRASATLRRAARLLRPTVGTPLATLQPVIDLHCHSTASDGSDSPRRLVELARRRGLTALALTDHDTVEGLAEAREAAAGAGVRLVPGCELSCEAGEATMHLLVYFLDDGPGPLQDRLAGLQAARSDRNRRIVTALQEHGLDVTLEEILAEAGGGSVGRPHVAGVLVGKGYVASIQEAFDVWLAKG